MRSAGALGEAEQERGGRGSERTRSRCAIGVMGTAGSRERGTRLHKGLEEELALIAHGGDCLQRSEHLAEGEVAVGDEERRDEDENAGKESSERGRDQGRARVKLPHSVEEEVGLGHHALKALCLQRPDLIISDELEVARRVLRVRDDEVLSGDSIGRAR